jgi:uncharacterized membrane protein
METVSEFFAPAPLFGAMPIDFAAFAWLFVCWLGYTYFADHFRQDRRTLVSTLHEYRVLWMRRMLERDIRTGDVNIVASLIHSDSLFATTSMFVLAGLVTILGTLDRARAVVSELSFAVQASKELWEVKVLLLVLIFVYAFFKFVWSLRQFNFALVMIGAAPMPEEVNAPDRADYPERAARLITRGVNTLNRGLRAYYFGLATLAWFIQPGLFAVASIWVVLVLYRREFRSITLRTLTTPDDNGGADGKDG